MSEPATVIDLSHRDNLSQLIYAQLRNEIIGGQWHPAAKLSIRQQAQRFRVSVTPVREALLQLASEKALVLEPRSFRVPVLSRAEFIEIRKARVALEGLLAGEAVVQPDAAFAGRLAALHEELIGAKLAGRYDVVMQRNRDFHFSLYEKASMPQVVSIVEGLWAQTGPYQHSLYRRETAVPADTHDHLRVIQAVRRGDAALAARAVVDDITLRGVRLEEIGAAEPSGFSDRA
ncbi:GntR family transcriptional regulator [Acuticoccus sp. I52.16.1]|uniref:GntR family transcriptional regulator n=1 Tax=Acuticoccus sp. I52.16.1 TaxID=2928472 RepID=UPI001FD54E01|nr:GntR family transcriptional regulator [Acuticoccus sp. I52.16.1]UOM33276.1 GntR family transcriptional regulator [Acuticoccus sp. I52.16.1]